MSHNLKEIEEVAATAAVEGRERRGGASNILFPNQVTARGKLEEIQALRNLFRGQHFEGLTRSTP
jgi:hypothetical protein